jgi:hypothetical protein
VSEEESVAGDEAPASEAAAPPAADVPGAPSHRGSIRLYLIAFGLVVLSFVAMALGGLSLLGRGVNVSPTGLFWASIVLSVLALVAGIGALFIPRPPG